MTAKKKDKATVPDVREDGRGDDGGQARTQVGQRRKTARAGNVLAVFFCGASTEPTRRRQTLGSAGADIILSVRTLFQNFS